MNESLLYTTHASAIGLLLLVASNKGLRSIRVVAGAEEIAQHLQQLERSSTLLQLVEAHGFLATACAAIDDYLANGTPLHLPFELAHGTALQRMVWLAIAKIPHGETISYTTLATRVGFPRAVRAVASACGANPLPLVIPCHRVLAKDGSIGGFSMLGGLEVKEHLLALESGEDWRNAVDAA